MRITYIAALAVSSVLLAAPICAAQLTTQAAAPHATEFRLKNGMRVVLDRQKSSPGTVRALFAVAAGTASNPIGQPDLAHLIEHLLAMRTKSDGVLWKDKLAKGKLMAFTGNDITGYWHEFPTEKLGDMLAYFKYIARGAEFSEEDLRLEKGPVQTEAGDEAGETIRTRWMEALGNPDLRAKGIEARTPRESVARLTYPMAKSFYERWYKPQCENVIIVGDFDEDTVRKNIVSAFENIPAGKVAACGSGQDWVTKPTIVDPEGKRALFVLNYQLPGAVTASRSPRLHELILNIMVKILDRRLAHCGEIETGINEDGFGVDRRLMGTVFPPIREEMPSIAINFGWQPGDVEAKAKCLGTVLGDMARNAPSKIELGTAIDQVVENLPTSLADIAIAHAETEIRSGVPAYTVTDAALVRQDAGSIAPAVFKRLAGAMIDPKAMGAALALPDNKQALTAEDLTSKIAAAARTPLRVTIAWSSVPAPKPTPVLTGDWPTSPNGGGAKLQLDARGRGSIYFPSNGVTIWLRPDARKGERVALYGLRQAKGPGEIFASADTSGVGGMTWPQYNKYAYANKLSWFIKSAPAFAEIQSSSEKGDLEAVLRQTFLTFTGKFELEARDEASETGRDRISALLSGQLGKPRKLDPLAAKKVFEAPGTYDFVLTGNFDVNRDRALLERYIGSLPRGESGSNGRLMSAAPRSAVLPEYRVTKRNGQANVAVLYIGDNLPKSVQEVVNYQALGTAITTRIGERLRQKEGAVYGYSASIEVTNKELVPVLTVSFSCDPKDVERLVAAAREEILRLAQEGFSGPEKQEMRSHKGSMGVEDGPEYMMSYLRLFVPREQWGTAPLPDAVDVDPDAALTAFRKFVATAASTAIVLAPATH